MSICETHLDYFGDDEFDKITFDTIIQHESM